MYSKEDSENWCNFLICSVMTWTPHGQSWTVSMATHLAAVGTKATDIICPDIWLWSQYIEGSFFKWRLMRRPKIVLVKAISSYTTLKYLLPLASLHCISMQTILDMFFFFHIKCQVSILGGGNIFFSVHMMSFDTFQNHAQTRWADETGPDLIVKFFHYMKEAVLEFRS